MSPRYRKRPVVVEAMQWDGSAESANAIMAWAPRGMVAYADLIAPPFLSVLTPRGVVTAQPTDWVIIGSRGGDGIAVDVYPCPAAVFAATYEAVP